MLHARHRRLIEATDVLPLQQLPHDLERSRPRIAPPGEEGEQAPFANHRRKVRQLPHPLRGDGPCFDLGREALIFEGPADRLFRDARVHAIGGG